MLACACPGPGIHNPTPCIALSAVHLTQMAAGTAVFRLNAPVVQELIGTLEEAKSKAVEISQKLAEASATASQIEEVRAKYKPAALRGAVLFFVLASLAAISNMYEYSLASFLAVFSLTLDTSKKVRAPMRLCHSDFLLCCFIGTAAKPVASPLGPCNVLQQLSTNNA